MKHSLPESSQPTTQQLPIVASHLRAPLRPAIIGQFLAVILIWSLTPLAAVWTVQEIHWAWGLFFRFSLAALVAIFFLGYFKIKLPLNAQACWSYMAGAIGLFGSMAFCYMGAQYVPSAIISIIYGLAPFLSGLISTLVLGRDRFLTRQWLGLTIAIIGMSMAIGLLSGALQFHFWGIVFELIAVLLYVLSTFIVGGIGASIHPIAQTVGATIVSWFGYVFLLPFFWTNFPDDPPSTQAIMAIIYSAVLSSVFAMMCYYSLIKVLKPTTLMLTMILTPVLATIWGAWLNQEAISPHLIIGVLCLCIGLLLYSYPRHNI